MQGLDFSQVTPFDPDAPLPSTENEPAIWGDISRWLKSPAKPCILVLARPDPKKNLQKLLRAYGESPLLRELANLVFFLGVREQIAAMSPSAAAVMRDIFEITDELDLWGSVAYPKHHLQSQKSDIFNYASASRLAARKLHRKVTYAMPRRDVESSPMWLPRSRLA